MRRLLLLLALAALLPVAGASASHRTSYPLKIGDAVDVVGTKIACYAINSNGKNGVACVLLARSGKPVTGSYGAGLAVDGTAVITKIKADGSGAPVFKRKLQRAAKVYRVRAGDVFGFQIDANISLGCQVINVTSTLVGPLYRGVKVSCFRATATKALPSTYGVSISDKMAGVYLLDAKSRVTSAGKAFRQPAG